SGRSADAHAVPNSNSPSHFQIPKANAKPNLPSFSRSFPAAARPNSPQHRSSTVASTFSAEEGWCFLLRGLDSRLSKDLPSDLQKLRCKVAFQALKFALRILELGNKIAETQATLFGVKVILELATKLHDDHLLTLVFSGFWIVQVHE
ncbi:hypothetical protein Ancab_024973, partial [Ancistrocladus abbreviatus]